MRDKDAMTAKMRGPRLRLPTLHEGDAAIIAATAGIGPDEITPLRDYGRRLSVREAIERIDYGCESRDIWASGEDADGGDGGRAAEERDAVNSDVARFLDFIRGRLLPDVVARELSGEQS
jgi:hypothetical protein